MLHKKPEGCVFRGMSGFDSRSTSNAWPGLSFTSRASLAFGLYLEARIQGRRPMQSTALFFRRIDRSRRGQMQVREMDCPYSDRSTRQRALERGLARAPFFA